MSGERGGTGQASLEAQGVVNKQEAIEHRSVDDLEKLMYEAIPERNRRLPPEHLELRRKAAACIIGLANLEEEAKVENARHNRIMEGNKASQDGLRKELEEIMARIDLLNDNL